MQRENKGDEEFRAVRDQVDREAKRGWSPMRNVLLQLRSFYGIKNSLRLCKWSLYVSLMSYKMRQCGLCSEWFFVWVILGDTCNRYKVCSRQQKCSKSPMYPLPLELAAKWRWPLNKGEQYLLVRRWHLSNQVPNDLRWWVSCDLSPNDYMRAASSCLRSNIWLHDKECRGEG